MAAFAGLALAPQANALTAAAKSKAANNRSSFGLIRGIVKDQNGKPIANAIVAISRAGTSKILKQVRSAANGSFLARVVPGAYTILAVAEGFNPVTFAQVQVNRSTELYYGFELERAGSGNTLPEKRADRNNPKWRIRAAQSQRSIYQATEGKTPTDNSSAKTETDETKVEETIGTTDEAETESQNGRRKGQYLVESFAANTSSGSYMGLNFAAVHPINEKTQAVFAGQTGFGKNAPQRVEARISTQLSNKHKVRLGASAVNLGQFKLAGNELEKDLAQFSFQALDEWQVKDGIILVLGFDVSRFVGAGNDASVTPRVGLQLDVDPKTRLSASYTGATEERSWQSVIELEGEPVVFRQNLAAESVTVENGKPVMQKNRRFEIGVERVLDNSSSLEAAAFFDTVSGRGVGLAGTPVGFLPGEQGPNEQGPNEQGAFSQTVNQTGRAQGFRVVYSRRFSGLLSASAGYSFGRGQALSAHGLRSPAQTFEDKLFQTFVGQLTASLKNGTRVKTVLRLSPQAAVFAIDPFAGKMAIYDPTLSVLVIQRLPNLGLPLRAEAIIDARNLFDYAITAINEEGSLKLTSGGRILRGGIAVRF